MEVGEVAEGDEWEGVRGRTGRVEWEEGERGGVGGANQRKGKKGLHWGVGSRKAKRMANVMDIWKEERMSLGGRLE